MNRSEEMFAKNIHITYFTLSTEAKLVKKNLQFFFTNLGSSHIYILISFKTLSVLLRIVLGTKDVHNHCAIFDY